MRNIFANLNTTEKTLFTSSFFQGLAVETSYFVGITGYAAYNLHATPALLATIMIFVNAASIAGSAIAGISVDRFGPRKTVVVAAITLIVAALSSQFVGSNIHAFILFATVLSLLIAISRTSYNSYAPYVEEGKAGLKHINSLVLFGTYTSAVIGPTLGGFIVKYYPTMTVFLFAAGAILISLILVVFARENFTPRREEEGRHPLRQATEGIRLVLTHQSLRYYLVVGVILFFSFGAYDALESLYYKDVVGASIQWIGWVNGAIGVGLVVGVALLSRFSSKLVNSVALAVFVGCEGLGSIVYVSTRSIYVVMVGGFLLGIAFGIAEPMMRTLIQADAPLSSVGRVMGAVQMFRVGFTIMPLMLAPSLAKLFGIQQVLVGASILTVILALCLLPLARRVDISHSEKRLIYPINPLTEGDDVSPRERMIGTNE